MTDIQQIHDRQEALDGEIKLMVKSISQLTTNVAHLEQSQKALFSRFDKQAEDDRARSRPQWQTMIAASTLVVVIGAAVLTPINWRLSKTEHQQEQQFSQLLMFSEFIGQSKAKAEMDRKHIDTINEQMTATLKTRFTDTDGVEQEERIMSRINEIERRVFEHQSTKGGHE